MWPLDCTEPTSSTPFQNLYHKHLSSTAHKPLAHCVSGLVVEWLPATESARVRFPAHAQFVVAKPHRRLHTNHPWALSSVEERPFRIREVEGSNPSVSSLCKSKMIPPHGGSRNCQATPERVLDWELGSFQSANFPRHPVEVIACGYFPSARMVWLACTAGAPQCDA